MPESPLSAAAAAKRRRDLAGEIGAVLEGSRALESAPWSPSRPGDRLTITMEANASEPQWTETYEVTEDGTELRLLDTTAPDGMSGGWYAGAPEFLDADPFETPWMEAGPDRLTISRGGTVVHQGRYAVVPLSAASEDRTVEDERVEGFVFSACQFLALDEHGEQLPEHTLDLPVHGRVLYRPDPGSPCGERFEIRMEWQHALVLPPTSRQGHDVYLWAGAPGGMGRTEVWLHRVHFDPAQRGAQGGYGWAEIGGIGRGRSLHRVRDEEVPVPAASTAAPAWCSGIER
ncbi:hypothetical protein AB0J38_27795 [Streptomyces sp. NPDC050095]|uniref:hypothetical protein n=1 Tax=unclassified Streptomyces TaxID=2593676 RepID=UPI00343FB514